MLTVIWKVLLTKVCSISFTVVFLFPNGITSTYENSALATMLELNTPFMQPFRHNNFHPCNSYVNRKNVSLHLNSNVLRRAWRLFLLSRSIAYHHHHHHHHVHEGLGVFSVPWSSRWSWSLHLFLGRPMLLRPFGLYCSACFGILFVSILCTCCNHFFWYCFISFTMFSAPVFPLIHLCFLTFEFRCLTQSPVFILGESRHHRETQYVL